MNPSLHAQASAVSVMSGQARQRGNLRLKPVQWEMMEPQLAAAATTLMLIQSWRAKLLAIAPDFIAEIEGGA